MSKTHLFGFKARPPLSKKAAVVPSAQRSSEVPTGTDWPSKEKMAEIRARAAKRLNGRRLTIVSDLLGKVGL
jgi:hypothetical protein